MKTMVLAVLSLLFSFWLVMGKMTGMREILPQGWIAGAVLFVMMMALGVAIYEIIETVLMGIFRSEDTGAYIKSQMKTIVIAAILAVAVIVIGFGAPAML